MLPTDPFRAPGRWLKGNLHTHSTVSDGAKSAAAVCAHYRDAGYDFLAVTDHFLAHYGFAIADTRSFRTAAFTTLIGAEVHAPANRRGDLWHLVAIGVPLDFGATRDDEDGLALARRCLEAGAFVALAHPEWSGLEPDEAAAFQGVHAVEIYNHGAWTKASRGSGIALWDQLLARGLSFGGIASDDAHLKVDDSFGGWVMVKARANAPDAILEALKAGAYYASQGPEIHDLVRVGRELVVRCSPARRVIVVGHGAAHSARQGTDITEARIDLRRFRRHGYCRVVVVDAADRCAWSNPLRVDRPDATA